MRTIAHLSDLHFGRVRDEVLEPLVQAVAALRPDLVAISGDLTMRARAREFAQARAFLEKLPRPQVVLPGNHDVPHRSPIECLFNPLERYEQHISRDLGPYYEDAEIAVAGVNTARAFGYRGGRINAAQVSAALGRFRTAAPRATRIVVTHHPFDLPPRFSSRELVGRARMALATFLEAGADVFLAGHMHVTYCGHTAERWKIRDYAALVIQAGTATSTRERNECNAFNCVRIHGDRIAVEPHAWDGAAFRPLREETFHRTSKGWRAYAAVQPPSMVSTDPVTNSASAEQR
jgi:3',5'-cyclic AMP phosphodiesterase CpdA